MRIRTLKPEFWAHPVMSRQTDAAKLLAIGLLNYADDEGFFYADAPMVRAAIRPLDDDSTIVRRSLDELSRIGYIEVREHATHGTIGKIVAFTEHQRVDRPKASKIKGLWDSSIVRRSIVDQSSLEQGTGNREQGTREQDIAPRVSAGTPPVVVSALGIQRPSLEIAQEAPTMPVAPSEPLLGGSGPSGTGKSPRRASKASPDGLLHATFIAEWCAAFENARGVPYKVDGGRDGKAVKELLGFSKDVDELIALAQMAWSKSGPKFWWCERAVTIHAFAARLNEIRAELAADEKPSQPAATHQPVLMGREMKL